MFSKNFILCFKVCQVKVKQTTYVFMILKCTDGNKTSQATLTYLIDRVLGGQGRDEITFFHVGDVQDQIFAKISGKKVLKFSLL